MAEEKKRGLYENIRRAQERAAKGGRPVRKRGEKGAPTDEAFRRSARTAKKNRKKKSLGT